MQGREAIYPIVTLGCARRRVPRCISLGVRPRASSVPGYRLPGVLARIGLQGLDRTHMHAHAVETAQVDRVGLQACAG